MRPDDVAACERLTARTYYEADTRLYQRAWPDPVERSPERGTRWRARTAHVLATDPGGCWVAEQDGEILGCAISFRRELMWILASFVVERRLQGHGVGTALLSVAQEYGRGCLRSMLASSGDPAAVRRYRLAGFTLHPQYLLWGTVDRASLPVVEHVREGSAGDVDLLDSLDRRTRGAAHGPDHAVLLAENRLVVTDRPAGSGYCYVGADGSPAVLAATNRRTATALLWEALASSSPRTRVVLAHVTQPNDWALDVGLAARLSAYSQGYLALRHLKPPAPYLPHGALL
ncbi:GNAT family N-acetyltransferase [Nocardioides mangrovicus]|uniref:GNAT family N-acetyltransferase n=2 Tax=Nocardioides mangrovicus TaxID=2478913 RepID=A0A3L8P4F9_9ACTN|nr:GNAT family N-acetyltransferase [Nocardioides mangrovicus]